MRKISSVALLLIAFALPFSNAFADPQHGGGHEPHVPSMNHDSHGDAVSAAAHTAKADGTNVGKAVSPIASDKNEGHEKGHGHHKGH